MGINYKNAGIALLVILYMLHHGLHAQTELKFNAASALILIPNVGIEIPISNKFSFQLDVSGSFWDSFDVKPLQFTQAFGEVRYYGKDGIEGFFLGAM